MEGNYVLIKTALTHRPGSGINGTGFMGRELTNLAKTSKPNLNLSVIIIILKIISYSTAHYS